MHDKPEIRKTKALLADGSRPGAHLAPYFIVVFLLWLMLLKSGVHATIAGVAGAFTVPARFKYDTLDSAATCVY